MTQMKRRGLLVVVCLALLGGGYGVRAQEGRRLEYGDVVQGTITSSEYRRVFYFQARRGDVVSAQMTPTSGNLDALLLLADNGGSVLAMSDDADQSLGAAVTMVQIPDDNFYFVIATRFGHGLGVTEGGFELRLERVGLVSAEGAYLNYGDSVIGFLDDAAPRMRYVFEAQRGDIVNVRMRRLAGGNLDSYVYITDGAGQVLVADDDGGGGLDAEIDNFLILEPGYYAVVATRFGQEAGATEGSFVLTLETAPTSGQGVTPEAALLLRYGAEHENYLDGEYPMRYYTFGAQRGDIVTISLDRTSGNLDPLLALYNSRQEVLIEDDDSGPDNNALIESFIVPETGTYYILAARFDREAGTSAGGYVIRLEGATGEAPVVEPGILTILYGSTVAGQITDEHSAATYAFLARAGDMITISMTRTAGDLDPLLLLFTADSTQLAQDDDSGPGDDAQIAAFVIPEDGIYYLIATRYEFQEGTTGGRYSLSLVRQDSASASAQP
jgi:hypothetical protein